MKNYVNITDEQGNILEPRPIEIEPRPIEIEPRPIEIAPRSIVADNATDVTPRSIVDDRLSLPYKSAAERWPYLVKYDDRYERELERKSLEDTVNYYLKRPAGLLDMEQGFITDAESPYKDYPDVVEEQYSSSRSYDGGILNPYDIDAIIKPTDYTPLKPEAFESLRDKYISTIGAATWLGMPRQEVTNAAIKQFEENQNRGYYEVQKLRWRLQEANTQLSRAEYDYAQSQSPDDLKRIEDLEKEIDDINLKLPYAYYEDAGYISKTFMDTVNVAQSMWDVTKYNVKDLNRFFEDTLEMDGLAESEIATGLSLLGAGAASVFTGTAIHVPALAAFMFSYKTGYGDIARIGRNKGYDIASIQNAGMLNGLLQGVFEAGGVEAMVLTFGGAKLGKKAAAATVKKLSKIIPEGVTKRILGIAQGIVSETSTEVAQVYIQAFTEAYMDQLASGASEIDWEAANSEAIQVAIQTARGMGGLASIGLGGLGLRKAYKYTNTKLKTRPKRATKSATTTEDTTAYDTEAPVTKETTITEEDKEILEKADREDKLKEQKEVEQKQKAIDEAVKEENEFNEDGPISNAEIKEATENPNSYHTKSKNEKVIALEFSLDDILSGQKDVSKKISAIMELLNARANALATDVNTLIKEKGIKAEKVTQEEFEEETGVSAEGKKAALVVDETNNIIKAFDGKADISSIVHEIGHIFRQDINEQDQAILDDWVGIDKGAEWDVAAEEKFAKGFEKYLAEGKAPNKGLKTLFEKFSRWLTAIYGGIQNIYPEIQLTDEVRGVFGRLLEAQKQEQIQEAEDNHITTILTDTAKDIIDGSKVDRRYTSIADVMMRVDERLNDTITKEAMLELEVEGNKLLVNSKIDTVDDYITVRDKLRSALTALLTEAYPDMDDFTKTFLADKATLKNLAIYLMDSYDVMDSQVWSDVIDNVLVDVKALNDSIVKHQILSDKDNIEWLNSLKAEGLDEQTFIDALRNVSKETLRYLIALRGDKAGSIDENHPQIAALLKDNRYSKNDIMNVLTNLDQTTLDLLNKIKRPKRGRSLAKLVEYEKSLPKQAKEALDTLRAKGWDERDIKFLLARVKAGKEDFINVLKYLDVKPKTILFQDEVLAEAKAQKGNVIIRIKLIRRNKKLTLIRKHALAVEKLGEVIDKFYKQTKDKNDNLHVLASSLKDRYEYAKNHVKANGIGDEQFLDFLDTEDITLASKITNRVIYNAFYSTGDPKKLKSNYYATLQNIDAIRKAYMGNPEKLKAMDEFEGLLLNALHDISPLSASMIRSPDKNVAKEYKKSKTLKTKLATNTLGSYFTHSVSELLHAVTAYSKNGISELERYFDERLFEAETRSNTEKRVVKESIYEALSRIYQLDIYNDKGKLTYKGGVTVDRLFNEFKKPQYEISVGTGFKPTGEFDHGLSYVDGQYRKDQTTINVSKNQLLYLYLLFNDATLTERLLNDGLDENTYQDVMSHLSDADIAFAHRLQSILQGVAEDYWKADVYGMKELQYKSDFYIPVRISGNVNFPGKTGKVVNVNALYQHQKDVIARRTKYGVNIELADVFNVFDQVMGEMIQEKNYTDLIMAKNYIINDDRIKRAIEFEYGADVYKHLNNAFKDIFDIGKRHSFTIPKLEAFYNGLIRSQIALGFATGIKQLVSTVNYASLMPAIDFVKYAPKAFSDISDILDTDFMKNRANNIDEAIKDARQSDEYKRFMITPTFSNFLMLNVKYGDKLGFSIGANIYKHYLMDNGYTKEEAVNKALLEGNKTQQSAYSSQRSNFQSSRNSLTRGLMFYSSAPVQAIRQEWRAITDLARNPSIDQLKHSAKTIAIYQIVVPSLLSMISSATTGDDDWLGNAIVASILGPLGSMYSIGRLITYMVKKAIGLPAYQSYGPFADFTTKVLRHAEKIITNITEGNLDDIELVDLAVILEAAMALSPIHITDKMLPLERVSKMASGAKGFIEDPNVPDAKKAIFGVNQVEE